MEEIFEAIWLHFGRFLGGLGPQKPWKTIEGVAKIRKSLDQCSELEKITFGIDFGTILAPSWGPKWSQNRYKRVLKKCEKMMLTKMALRSHIGAYDTDRPDDFGARREDGWTHPPLEQNHHRHQNCSFSPTLLFPRTCVSHFVGIRRMSRAFY